MNPEIAAMPARDLRLENSMKSDRIQHPPRKVWIHVSVALVGGSRGFKVAMLGPESSRE